jgi:hypothetical protein
LPEAGVGRLDWMRRSGLVVGDRKRGVMLEVLPLSPAAARNLVAFLGLDFSLLGIEAEFLRYFIVCWKEEINTPSATYNCAPAQRWKWNSTM